MLANLMLSPPLQRLPIDVSEQFRVTPPFDQFKDVAESTFEIEVPPLLTVRIVAHAGALTTLVALVTI